MDVTLNCHSLFEAYPRYIHDTSVILETHVNILRLPWKNNQFFTALLWAISIVSLHSNHVNISLYSSVY